MKIIICLVIGCILLFDFCIFKAASNASRMEEELNKKN